MEESKGEEDGLRTAVRLFMQGNARRRRVKEALEHHPAAAPTIRIELGASRTQWRRLRRLHDASFGEALFGHLTIASMLCDFGWL